MNDFLSKLTSYDFFNNLLPGVILLVAFRDKELGQLALENLVVGAFMAYIAGMICSRIGSLIVGTVVLDRIQSKLKLRRPYEDYVMASKVDSDILVFNEKNNSYRTLISCFLCIGLGKLIQADWNDFTWADIFNPTAIFISLVTILFVVSYFKQTNFISKRIDIAKTNAANEKTGNI